MLDHVTLIAAAVPLRTDVLLSVHASRPNSQAIASGGWRRPLCSPQPPRILPEVIAETRFLPSLTVIGGNFDFADARTAIVRHALQSVGLASAKLFIGCRSHENRMKRHLRDRHGLWRKVLRSFVCLGILGNPVSGVHPERLERL